VVLPHGAIIRFSDTQILRYSRRHLIGGYQHGRQQHAGIAAVAAAADAADAVPTAVCGTPRHQVCEGVDVSLRLLPRDAWVRLHEIHAFGIIHSWEWQGADQDVVMRQVNNAAAAVQTNALLMNKVKMVTARNMHSADQLKTTK